MPEKKRICLIIPCYNEESRIDLNSFDKFNDDLVYVFVDDGSSDGTFGLLKSRESDFFIVLKMEKNSGKAEAVRRGMLFADSDYRFCDVEWFGFWDADLATPLEENVNFILYRDSFNPEASAIFGSRIHRLGAKINRSFFRHVIGRLLATFMNALFKVGTYDSQCGAKLFRRDSVKKAFGDPFVSKWLFDLEIIIRLRGMDMLECPLKCWSDVGGSKLLTFRNILRVAIDIAKLWKQYG